MTSQTKALVVIDPQNCFMNIEGMPLPVPGATDDMRRLASRITEEGSTYDQIFVTLDTHPADHISHAVRWVDASGNHPDPFTIITPEAYEAGVWKASGEADQAWQGQYLKELDRPHCIWPTHGQLDQVEHDVYAPLQDALDGWENTMGNKVVYVEKGMHRDTEQFGVFGASVPILGAPETDLNQDLIDQIAEYDLIDFAGEALSHCVKDSMIQFLSNVAEKKWGAVSLLRDCTSSVAPIIVDDVVVADFPAEANLWVSAIAANGVYISTHAEVA